MKPGPKPVDVERLRQEAMRWACFFYTLRDGQPGYMQRIEISPERTLGTLIAKDLIGGNPPRSMRGHRARVGKPLGPMIPIPVSEAAMALPEQGQDLPVLEMDRYTPIPKNKQVRMWSVVRPVMPKREIWEQLTKVDTADQLATAAGGIGAMRGAFISSLEEWSRNPDKAIRHFAKEICEAKKLPHYPRTERERSDDKRVVFLAKVMAGLTLGLAPITAVKRLSHWSWPKDWIKLGERKSGNVLKGVE